MPAPQDTAQQIRDHIAQDEPDVEPILEDTFPTVDAATPFLPTRATPTPAHRVLTP